MSPFEHAPQGVVTTEQLAAVFRDRAEKGVEMDENALKLKDAWLAGRMKQMDNAETLRERLAARLVVADEMINQLSLLRDGRDLLEDVLATAEERGDREIAEDAKRMLAEMPTEH